MKVFVVLSVLVAIVAAAPTSDEDMLQAFDFDALLSNEELRQKSFDCLLDKVECGDFQTLKDATLHVVKNKCAKCNGEQKARYDRVLKKLQEQFEDVYNALQKKVANGN